MTWLEQPWITKLNKAQLEAIYSVFYNLAEAVFELNARPDGERTCEAAVRKTVRYMNHMPWYEHMSLWLTKNVGFIPLSSTVSWQ